MGLAPLEGTAMNAHFAFCNLPLSIWNPNDKSLQIANWLAGLLFVSFVVPSVFAEEPKQAVIVVVGAEGSAEFGPQFQTWASQWEAAARQGQADYLGIGLESTADKADRDVLAEHLQQLAGKHAQSVWLVLIGHGTFDGKTARFNLRGPDVSAAELAEWLAPLERPLAVVNCTSSSGPFVAALSGNNRAIIAATRSGHEYNFARLGEHLAAAIADPAADLDKDEQTSLLEAYLAAAARTREFYAGEGRLATEHALLDDNGDKLGTPADWFQGLKATKTAKEGAALDGALAGQFVLVRSSREEQLPAAIRTRRDELERELSVLRQKKLQVSEEEYLKLIEPVLVELSRLYQSAESAAEPTP
jgi:hypothetical protein